MSRFIHPTTLRSAEDEIERSTWVEIFFDLIFSVIITELANRLSHHLTYFGILQCSALFLPVMWTWASFTVFAARFDNNDIIHWLMTFVIMFAGIIIAVQIPTALENGSFGFALGVLIAQAAILLLYLRVYYYHSAPSNILMLYVLGFGSGGICWALSLFFDAPIKFMLWALGMSIYLLIPWFGKKRILAQAPLDVVYIPERFGLFTIIILGQTVASVIYALRSASWNVYAVITSIMAFILAILIWGQYYRFTQIADYKCTLSSGQPYIYIHIPLIMGLIIMGVCVEHFIKMPTFFDENLNIIFAFSSILYLTSFYFLQYIAIRQFKIRAIAYIVGIIAILFLFLFRPLAPFITMSGLVFIFTIHFGIQFWLGYKLQRRKIP